MYVIESYTSVGINGTIGPFETQGETLEAIVRLQDEADPFAGYQVAVLYGLDEWLEPYASRAEPPTYAAWTADDIVVPEETLWAAQINEELRLLVEEGE